MSIKKKKAPSLESIINNENVSEEVNATEILMPKKYIPSKTPENENTNINKVEKISTTIILPLPVKDKLEEILFSERRSKKSQNDLFLEGIDMLFKDRGFPSIKALLQEDE